MRIKVFVLITTDAASSAEVVRRIREVPGVGEAYEVMGPYDIIAVVEVDELSQVTQILSHQIRQIPGVATTLTCVTMP